MSYREFPSLYCVATGDDEPPLSRILKRRAPDEVSERTAGWSPAVAKPRTRVSARREDGSLVCLSELPPRDTRWTRLRKLAVVECYNFGLISVDEVCERYDLSPSELAEWRAFAGNRSSREMIWTDRPQRLNSGTVAAGSLVIDLDGQNAAISGRIVDTSPSEWVILKTLAEADGAVVTTAMILGALYQRQEDAAGPKTADVLICRLRRKLGDHGDKVGAVWGRGYRLLVDGSGVRQ